MASELLSIPGKIQPAYAKDLKIDATEYNHLKYAGIVHPEIIDALGVYYSEQGNNLDALIALYGGLASGQGGIIAPRGMSNQDYSNIVSKNVKMLSNHEFAWRIQSSRHKLYKFSRNPEGPIVNGKLGVNGAEFFVYLNRDVLATDDIFVLAGDYHQIMIRGVEQTGRIINGMHEVRCRVRYMITPGIVNDGCPIALVQEGMETQRIYNIKPERSEHGSNSSLTSGDWMKNTMTTMRSQWTSSGNAYHTPVDNKWVVYTDEKGNQYPYWYNAQQDEAFRLLFEARSNYTFFGKKAVNPDGTFLKDERGREYFSGDGILSQNSRKMRIPYTRVTERLLDSIELSIHEDSLGRIEGKPRLAVWASVGFRQEFSKLLSRLFTNTNAAPLYYNEGGMQGVKSDFMVYETTIAQFIVYCGDGLSSRWWPSQRDSNGSRLNNNRAYIINISDMVGGKPNMMLLSQKGRTNVMGKIVGMAEPNGGTLTTAADVIGEHFLTTAGVAVTSPNSIIDLRKSA